MRRPIRNSLCLACAIQFPPRPPAGNRHPRPAVHVCLSAHARRCRQRSMYDRYSPAPACEKLCRYHVCKALRRAGAPSNLDRGIPLLDGSEKTFGLVPQ
eukprot:IDg15327t1